MKPYLLKRVLRIVPAYYFVLLLAVSGLIPYYEVPGEQIGARLVYHLLFFQDYLYSNIVVAFWSLGVEEKFYLTAPFVWAAIVLVRSRAGRYGIVAGIALLGPLFRFLTYLDGAGTDSYEAFFYTFRSPFHVSIDPLYIGVLAAMIYRDRHDFTWATTRRSAHRMFGASIALVGWLLLGHELLATPIGLFDATIQPLLLAVGFGGVVLSVALGGGPSRWLGRRILFIVSKLSYSLYLVHLLVIPGTIVALETMGWFRLLPSPVAFMVFLVPYLVLSTALALVVYWIVEQPFLAIKARLDRHPERHDQTRTSPPDPGNGAAAHGVVYDRPVGAPRRSLTSG